MITPANAEWRFDLRTGEYVLMAGYTPRHASTDGQEGMLALYPPLHGIRAHAPSCFMGCGPADYVTMSPITGAVITVCCDCSPLVEAHGALLSEL